MKANVKQNKGTPASNEQKAFERDILKKCNFDKTVMKAVLEINKTYPDKVREAAYFSNIPEMPTEILFVYEFEHIEDKINEENGKLIQNVAVERTIEVYNVILDRWYDKAIWVGVEHDLKKNVYMDEVKTRLKIFMETLKAANERAKKEFTIEKLEDILGWRKGTIDKYLEGKEPDIYHVQELVRVCKLPSASCIIGPFDIIHESPIKNEEEHV